MNKTFKSVCYDIYYKGRIILMYTLTYYVLLCIQCFNATVASIKPSKRLDLKNKCPFVSIASFKMSWSWEFLLYSIQVCPFHLVCLDSFEQKMTFHAPNAATMLSTWGNDWNIERRVSEANILGHPRETFNFLCNFSKAARKFQLGPFTLMFKRKIIVEY